MFAEIISRMVVLRPMVGRHGVASVVHMSSDDSVTTAGAVSYLSYRPLAARVARGGLSGRVPGPPRMGPVMM